MQMLKESGILSTDPLEGAGTIASSADILLHLLVTRWAVAPSDKDLVVMHHEVEWTSASGEAQKTTSSLVLTGEGGERSAMAKTVGLPMGILARMVLRNAAGLPIGVCIPTMTEVYGPILRELEEEGIRFTES